MFKTMTEQTVAFAVDYDETDEEFTARIVDTIQSRMNALKTAKVYALED